MTSRLFIALKIPDDILDFIKNTRDDIYPFDANWESDDKLHVTLKFLGETDEIVQDKLIVSLNGLFLREEKIKCELGGFGFFYRDKLPTILWAGIIAEARLFELADKTEDVAVSLGFPKENKKFKPHITLLRIKKNGYKDITHAFDKKKFYKKEFYIENAALIKSTLRPKGSVYEDVKNYKLK